MDGVTFDTLMKWLQTGALVFLVVAFIKGWIVPKWVYDKLEAQITTGTVPKWAYDKLENDCKRMTEIAFRVTELSERSTTVAEHVVKGKETTKETG